MNRKLSSLTATTIAVLGAGLAPACGPSSVLAGLDKGDSGVKSDSGSGTTPDAAFVCTPPADATRAPITFTGALFDSAKGCLASAPIALPICGCFMDTGLDSSTWCFVAPDGTTYFGISNDQCAVQIPDGWYATQTFGPSPFGTPTSAQEAACKRVAATSTAKGSYDMPGPPACGSTTSDSGVPRASCDPLVPPAVTLGTILGAGKDSQSILYVGEEAPDSGQDRVFVSKGTTLYRKYVSGGGQSGSPPNADYTFSFHDPDADASNAHALLIQERRGTVTAMALGPADSRSFYAPDAGDELLTVVDSGTVADFKLQDLPVLVEYVADVSNGKSIVVTEPTTPSGYSGFRLFYGATSDMVEYPIAAYDREDTRDDIQFSIGATTYTARLAFVSSLFSGDAGLGPSSLDTGAINQTPRATLPMTLRALPTPTTLSGFSFDCLGSDGG